MKTALLLHPLLLAGCRRLTPEEAMAEELYHQTTGEALLHFHPLLFIALLLITQAFTPAIHRASAALIACGLRLAGTQASEGRSRLLATCLAWLGLSAGILFLGTMPGMADDYYFSNLGLAGDSSLGFTCLAASLCQLLIAQDDGFALKLWDRCACGGLLLLAKVPVKRLIWDGEQPAYTQRT